MERLIDGLMELTLRAESNKPHPLSVASVAGTWYLPACLPACLTMHQISAPGDVRIIRVAYLVSRTSDAKD